MTENMSSNKHESATGLGVGIEELRGYMTHCLSFHQPIIRLQGTKQGKEQRAAAVINLFAVYMIDTESLQNRVRTRANALPRESTRGPPCNEHHGRQP